MDTNFKEIVASYCYTLDFEGRIILSNIINDILVPTKFVHYLEYLSQRSIGNNREGCLRLVCVWGGGGGGCVELTLLPILTLGVVVGWGLEE